MTSGRYTPNLGNNSSYSNGKMQQELDKIKLALDNVLSRYADQPNQMESDLDMNSNQILNLLDAVDLSEPATYRQLLAGLGGTTPVYNSEEVAVQGQLEYQLPITDSSDAKDYWVYVGGIRQAPDTDYTIDLPTGKLVFVEQPPAGETILSFGFRPNVKFVDGNIQIPVVREKVDVTVNGQLDYTFNLDLTRSTIHITGSGVDDGQKFEGVHYKLTSANSLQFFESYPIGSKIVIGVPTNEGASSLGALVFGDIELAKGANVQDGTLIRVPSRGNAEYIVEPSSYTPVAEGVLDHTMSTGQVLKLVHDGEINVKWAGAKGDGVTDDTAAIQACLDVDAYPLDGGISGIYIPKGIFVISNLHRAFATTLTFNIRGAGRTATFLDQKAGATGDAFRISSPDTILSVYSRVSGFALRGQGKVNHGLVVQMIARSEFDDIYIQGFNHGFRNEGGLVLTCQDVNSLSNNVGYYAAKDAASPIYPNLVLFNGGVFSGNSTFGMDLLAGNGTHILGTDISGNGTAGDLNTGGIMVRATHDDEIGSSTLTLQSVWLELNKGWTIQTEDVGSLNLNMNDVKTVSNESGNAVNIGLVGTVTLINHNAPSVGDTVNIAANNSLVTGGLISTLNDTSLNRTHVGVQTSGTPLSNVSNLFEVEGDGNLRLSNGDINGTGDANTVFQKLGSGRVAHWAGATLAYQWSSVGVGFNGNSPIAKPTVTGATGGNAALQSLLSALQSYGLITNSTT